MEITPDSVKEWLSHYPDRDRHWLAAKCNAEKGTVDNWLSTARGIPAKALLIIESLMRSDLELDRAKQPVPPMTVVLEVPPATFDAYNKAALEAGMIIREWAVDVLSKAAIRDANASYTRKAQLRVAEGEATAPETKKRAGN